MKQRFLIPFITIATIGSSLLLYSYSGNPKMPDFPLNKRPNIFYPITPDLTSHTPKTLVELSLLVPKLQTIIENNPSDPANWLLLGNTLAQLSRFDEAATSYEYALEFLPKDIELQRTYLYLKGISYYQQSDFAQARKSWSKLLTLFPKENDFTKHIDILLQTINKL